MNVDHEKVSILSTMSEWLSSGEVRVASVWLLLLEGTARRGVWSGVPGVLLREAGMLPDADALPVAPSGVANPNISAIAGGTFEQLAICKCIPSAFRRVSSRSIVPDMSFMCCKSTEK